MRGTNWVGDAVMTLPALNALADNFPKARLSVLTRPWAAGVYCGQPSVKAVLEDGQKNLAGRLRQACSLRSKKFDLAVLFQNAFGAAAAAALAGIPERWGYARDGRRFLLSRAVEISPENRQAHEVFYYLDLLENLGLTAPYRPPHLAPGPEAEMEAGRILGEAGVKAGERLLILAPGAAFGAAKRWPAEYFAGAARQILAEHPARVIIMGGSGEKPVAEALAGLLTGPALNLAGRTSLRTAMAIIRRGALMLTNDSGLMHMGGALGVPLVAAFGPTNPRTTAPLGLSRLIRSQAACAPCLKRECPLKRQICWDDVGPERVARAALELLAPPRLQAGKRPAVFLDRDGTINREVSYLSRPEQLKLIGGAGRAVADIRRAGYKAVVVTNQSGLARGLFTTDDLDKIHQRLRELLKAEGAELDGIYYCPHHPEGSVEEFSRSCACRKPESALYEKAADDLNIDLAHSIWVGDKLSDLSPAEKFGGRSVLVMSGYGLAEAAGIRAYQPTLLAPDLSRAAQWAVAQLSNENRISDDLGGWPPAPAGKRR